MGEGEGEALLRCLPHPRGTASALRAEAKPRGTTLANVCEGKLPTYPTVCTMISFATLVIPRNPE